MSTCQCQSSLHNHVEGACPNEVEEGSDKCNSCKEKDEQIRLGALGELPVAVGPPSRNSDESLIVVPPDKPEQ